MDNRLHAVLHAAQSVGIGHNNKAGGQWLLVATDEQLVALAEKLAPTAAQPAQPLPQQAEARDASEAFAAWLPRAYREDSDVTCFTKHNMEVAFRAGVEWRDAMLSGSKTTYTQRSDGESFEVASGEIHRIACCDCGLVHDMTFVSHDGLPIGVAAARNDDETGRRRSGCGFGVDIRMRLAGIAAECTDGETTAALDALLEQTMVDAPRVPLGWVEAWVPGSLLDDGALGALIWRSPTPKDGLIPIYTHPAPAVDRGLLEAASVAASILGEVEQRLHHWRVPIGDEDGEHCGLYDLIGAHNMESLVDDVCAPIEGASLSTPSPVAPEPDEVPPQGAAWVRAWQARFGIELSCNAFTSLLTAMAATPAEPVAPGGVPVAWIRDQRGEFEGRQTLDPLFTLGDTPPVAFNGATYSPLYTSPPAPASEAPCGCPPEGFCGAATRCQDASEAPREVVLPEVPKGCPEKLKNGGFCPHHNLQCGWPQCGQGSPK